MKLTRKPLTAFITLLIFGVPTDVVWGDSHAMLNKIVDPSIFGEDMEIDDITLSEMRGGFTTTSGLQVTFGVQRVLYVNGALISTTSLNVLNLSNVNVTPAVPVATDVTANLSTADRLSTPTSAPQTNTVAPAVSTSVPNTVESSSGVPAMAAPAIAAATDASSDVASSSAAPATVASTASTSSAPSSAPPATQNVSATTASGSVAVIQVGAGNTVSAGAFSAASAGTLVQNTLNNQKIQNVTIISATVNSMQILKALNLQLAINSAINDSVRK